uniref:3'(2'),5'-bisphosphate nucleotidase n=3 Tax=Photinus pyralis TaxID=7054 RepID=A0A1Y1MY71_PHOPY
MANSVPLVLRLLASSVTAARGAGNIVREIVSRGGDQNNELTEEKRSMQRCLRASLCQQYPNLNIVWEEEGSNDETPTELIVTECDDHILSQQCPAEYVDVTSEDLVLWIDAEYTDHATVFVGISMNGKAIGGVIHQPCYNYVDVENPTLTGRTLWGLVHLGTGGFHTKELPSGTVTLTITEVQHNDLLTTVLDAFQPDEVLRSTGVGHNVMLLLEGKAHVYVFPSKECNKRSICAPDAVITAMGGKLTDIHGDTYEYCTNMEHTNVCGILATGKGIDHSSFVGKVPQDVRDALTIAKPNLDLLLDFEKCMEYMKSPEFKEFMESVKFVGFDPVKVKDSLMAIPGFTYEDMCACSYFFLSKGTNLTRILQKLNPSRKRELQGLISKYNLVSKINSPAAVTLARVAGCFPLAVLENLKKYREDRMPRPVTQDYFLSFSRVRFPRILMCNAIASLIPNEPFSTVTQSDLDKIIALITIYSAVESTFLNREHRDKSKPELYCIADTYVQLAYKSSIKSEEERQALVIYGQFAGVIDNCVLNPEISRLHDDLITHFKD